MSKNNSLKPFLTFIAITGFIVGVFPWVFSYQGTLFGRPLSVRALGDIVGVVLIMSGMSVLISQKTRTYCERLATELENMSESSLWKWILVLTFLFVFGAVSHKWRAHAMLSTHALDLGFFSNICWNIASGGSAYCSILDRNFSGVHANWILWPLSWFYHAWPDARVLLTAQVLFMSSAVPVLALILRRVTASVTATFLGCLMLISSPYFLHTLFNDFHPDTWQLPFLMAALWAFHVRRPFWVLAFSTVALLAKEDVSVVLSGFGLFLLLRPSWRWIGGLLLTIAVGVFLIQTHLIIPAFLEGEKTSLLLGRYTFGDSFSEILVTFLTKPGVILSAFFHDPIKYWRYLNYFFPMAGLAFAAPMYILPSFISVLPHLLAQANTQLSLADIYAIPSQPFLFVGAAVGFEKLMKREWFARRRVLVGSVCLIAAGLGVLNAPRTFRTLPRDRITAFDELQALVPRTASLAAQQNLYSHFDTRRTVQLFPIDISMPELQRRVLWNPEYVIADRIGNALPFDGPKLAQSIERMEQDSAYEKIFDRNGFLLFRRRATEPERWVEIINGKQTEPAHL